MIKTIHLFLVTLCVFIGLAAHAWGGGFELKSVQATAGGYAFVFESGAGIDADCDITLENRSPVRSMECFEDYGGMITIEWDGRDDAENPAAYGRYRLNIKGDLLAETIRPLEASVSFSHQKRPPGPLQNKAGVWQ